MLGASLDHGELKGVLLRRRDGLFVARVGMAHHAGGRVVPEHALDALGRGVGMGYSQHSGVVIVCDGTDAAAKRIARVLWNDPATGVMRHADAGYEQAVATAKKHALQLPLIK